MKKLLIVVDFQNDFVNGSLGFNSAKDLEPRIMNRILDAKSTGEDVIFTKDIHSADYLNSEEGINLPINHCIEGTKGCELFGRLKEFENQFPTFSKGAFGSIELGNYLLDKNYDVITVIGLVSYICVLSNAVICKSACPNAHIVVERDLTSSADKHAEDIGFEALKNLHVEIK